MWLSFLQSAAMHSCTKLQTIKLVACHSSPILSNIFMEKCKVFVCGNSIRVQHSIVDNRHAHIFAVTVHFVGTASLTCDRFFNRVVVIIAMTICSLIFIH